MLFDNWAGLVRVLVVGTAGYLALILILRISGKRTLTKLNAFDLVVTVALGSTPASVILSKSVALAEGVLALALLVLLQYVIVWLSLRSLRFEGLIKAEPVLLVRKGAFLDTALRRERITREEVLVAVRAQGSADIAGVSAVVLETHGSISVTQDVGNESTVLPGALRSDRQNPPQDDSERCNQGRRQERSWDVQFNPFEPVLAPGLRWRRQRQPPEAAACAVFSFGRFLGMADKLFAVPWRAFQQDATNKRFQLDVDKARLESALEFNKNDWPDMADLIWQDTITSYYGTKL